MSSGCANLVRSTKNVDDDWTSTGRLYATLCSPCDCFSSIFMILMAEYLEGGFSKIRTPIKFLQNIHNIITDINQLQNSQHRIYAKRHMRNHAHVLPELVNNN